MGTAIFTAPECPPNIMEWKAIYRDGSSLSQFNPDRTENKYTSIDRANLSQFHVMRNGEPVVIIHIQPGQQLIYRRRVAMHLTKFGRSDEAVYLVGWQENRNGTNVQMLCAVFEDGHIEVTDRFRADHPWFYQVNFLPEEEVKQ